MTILQTIKELMDGVLQYYTDNALPKLVADFASLELSPVDGRTLTDFMHTRGLQMRSLGQVAKLAAKLSHVQSLCVHEMVVRAFKHVLQAVVASCKNAADLPLNIAAALNVMLGASLLEEDLEKRPSSSKYLMWRWVETFVNKRFGWKLAGEVICSELRKYAILRGLCHKVKRKLDF
jgi:protein TIF31